MDARHRTTLLLAALAAGCTATPDRPAMPEPTRAWLARFADALEFVPAGMRSHWLSTCVVAAAADEPERRWLEVHAGRDFEPTWDVGVGPYVGVSIQDYGRGTVTRADFGNGDDEVRPPIGASPVWRHVEQKMGQDRALHPRETWSALVDDRFLVNASSEALLRQALTRDHSPRFGTLEPLPMVPPDTIDLVLRDLAGTPPPAQTPLGTNPPGTSAILVIAAEPPRIWAWGRDERALRALLRSCFGADAESAPALLDELDRHAVEFRLPNDLRIGERWLRCMMFLGASIFV